MTPPCGDCDCHGAHITSAQADALFKQWTHDMPNNSMAILPHYHDIIGFLHVFEVTNLACGSLYVGSRTVHDLLRNNEGVLECVFVAGGSNWTVLQNVVDNTWLGIVGQGKCGQCKLAGSEGLAALLTWMWVGTTMPIE
jgi:hypothetical protein